MAAGAVGGMATTAARARAAAISSGGNEAAEEFDENFADGLAGLVADRLGNAAVVPRVLEQLVVFDDRSDFSRHSGAQLCVQLLEFRAFGLEVLDQVQVRHQRVTVL